VRKVISHPTVVDVTTSLYESPPTSQHSIEGRTSLKVAARRLFSVDAPIAVAGVNRAQSVCIIAPPLLLFA